MKWRPSELRVRKLGMIYSYPMGVWLLVFFVIPLAIIFLYSFLTRDIYGTVKYPFTLSAYQAMFSKSYGVVLFRTIWITVLSTVLCLLLSLPAGYAMARSKNQTFLLFLVMVPFWTNSIIRIFAWITLLSSEGILSHMLQSLGLLDQGMDLMYNNGAVVLVLVYMYIPYSILPLFTTIDKFDFSLLDAARDLGATKFQAIVKVLLPNIKSGISTALIFTAIPIFGAYTVPQLVGGKESTMLGNIIVEQVQKARNLPLASAFSVVLCLASTFGVLWMLKDAGSSKTKSSLSQQAKVEANVKLSHQGDSNERA
ncbi:MAG: ABC transporter permease [Sphaerochaetaceae bacterium]|jgi:spermidine/putrescine transport system permease protein|nr:ABC transporter permease [Sphaerochaetaceae bacterium]